MRKILMQAPKGATSSNIMGHQYPVPKSGKIEVVNGDHVEVLKRHGYIETDDDGEPDFDSMEKDALVTFIEERGGEADEDMSMKKLKRLAREAHADAQSED